MEIPDKIDVKGIDMRVWTELSLNAYGSVVD
jgi:hypothetical protein